MGLVGSAKLAALLAPPFQKALKRVPWGRAYSALRSPCKPTM